ncbi:MAG: response regulator [Burkholderiales bacterium]|nr:MAG: response regulator [Burkholderiales bacterium]
MPPKERANILLVDDQPGKLATYEVILSDLDENLLKASSAKEALEILLKNDVAVILVDVCMPELDGFELARMIRDHPRFKETAIIFISAVVLSELDSLRAYDLGAVDYVSVPVVPGILRAKVRVFVDLYRKTRQLARINDELELRVSARTAELEAAIAQQELLAREVDHRARNALAVIQSIVSMMPPTSGASIAKVIEGRIRAMARAHTLLSHARWEGADLASLVDEELDPYRAGDRITVAGPAIAIRPNVAQNFALAIHELATNAAKYGALSQQGGRLDVSWKVEGDRLILRWLETNGPVVEKPQKLGFGSKVIEASIKRQLGGVIEKEWNEQGLRATVNVPVEHFMPPSSGPGEANRSEPSTGRAAVRMSGRRILLVEDEPLVAMMMSQMIGDLGATVVGPFGTVADAIAAGSDNLDAAVLDINVAGELVYPLAERLATSGTPMVFLTGYDAKSVDDRFNEADVLTKPIDEADLASCLASIFKIEKAEVLVS